MNQSVKISHIRELARSKDCVILSHYYTSEDVQKVADFTGDSLALSQKAAGIASGMILFAGVRFMAETAKVLCPDRKVLLPVMEAGCSLADSCDASELRHYRESNPDTVIVSYVNTSVEVKALTDICCTSSNALRVVESVPKERPIMFVPDRNLGGYIKSVLSRENMSLWNGACHVHDSVTLESVMALKSLHPKAKVLTHPECRDSIVAVSDVVGSTKEIIDACQKEKGAEFIIVTEPGVLFRIRQTAPENTYYSVSEMQCFECQSMKSINLDNIIECLENESPEILLDESVAKMASLSIKAMLEL